MPDDEETPSRPSDVERSDIEEALFGEEPVRRVEEERPEARELRRALELLDKADKAYKIYPSNSKILNEFIDRSYAAMVKFLDTYGSIQLSILPAELRYHRIKVLASEMKETSIPFKLYEGGLRMLAFFPGLEREELICFLDVLKKIRDVDEDEDNVVTLLWEKDVAHITYLVMDLEAETESGEADRIPDPGIERSELAKMISLRDVSQRVDESQIDQRLLPPEEAEAPTEKIYGLSDEDKEAIRKCLTFEEEYIPLYDFVTLLFRIFRMEREWDTFHEMAKILEKILGVLASRGDYAVCTSILSEMDEFVESDSEISDDHRQVFAEVIAAVGSSERVEEAAERLVGADPEEVETIFDFFQHLGPISLPHLCNVITEEHEERFMALINELGAENPQIVVECLDNPNPPVVRTMLRILAAGGASEALGSIAGLLNHPEPSIRQEAVDALAGTGEARAGLMMIQSLDDPDAHVRKAALHGMVHLAGEKAFTAILERIESKDFITRPFFEKRDLMVSACKADPARGVPLLKRILERRSFFQKEKNNETRQCAALALGELRSPQATEVLRKLQKSKDRVVRDACTISLRKAEGKEVTRRLM